MELISTGLISFPFLFFDGKTISQWSLAYFCCCCCYLIFEMNNNNTMFLLFIPLCHSNMMVFFFSCCVSHFLVGNNLVLFLFLFEMLLLGWSVLARVTLFEWLFNFISDKVFQFLLSSIFTVTLCTAICVIWQSRFYKLKMTGTSCYFSCIFLYASCHNKWSLNLDYHLEWFKWCCSCVLEHQINIPAVLYF